MAKMEYESIAFLRKLARQYRERLTSRGRYLLWAMLVLAAIGADTRRTQIFALFAVAAGFFLVAAVYGFLPRPRVRLNCPLPQRTTAGNPLRFRARVAMEPGRSPSDLHFSFPRPLKWGSSISYKPSELFLSVDANHLCEFSVELLASRRGRYLLRGAAARSADPLRFVLSREVSEPDQVLLAYPRFYSMNQFMVPMGRKYQPGGIPLASNTGDAIEFVGTRDYQVGDPVRNIHWRSWARRGEPVVKEYQEEYFCRIALILDTFLSPGAEVDGFEAGISVAASTADFFSRSEYVVDILAAGPDIYEVSAGRSLAYLENILDVLACLEPCAQPPFQAIGPQLFDKLEQITTVVAVLLDWDEARRDFLRRVKSLGAALRILVVHDGPTRLPWQSVGEELGEITIFAPADVERSLAATLKS
jgi:uncharacterized protein (DUF58 family)